MTFKSIISFCLSIMMTLKSYVQMLLFISLFAFLIFIFLFLLLIILFHSHLFHPISFSYFIFTFLIPFFYLFIHFFCYLLFLDFVCYLFWKFDCFIDLSVSLNGLMNVDLYSFVLGDELEGFNLQLHHIPI